MFGYIIRGSDPNNELDGTRGETTTITANYEGEPFWLDVKDGLREVRGGLVGGGAAGGMVEEARARCGEAEL